jgi:hypothetical protein
MVLWIYYSFSLWCTSQTTFSTILFILQRNHICELSAAHSFCAQGEPSLLSQYHHLLRLQINQFTRQRTYRKSLTKQANSQGSNAIILENNNLLLLQSTTRPSGITISA